MNIVFGQCLGPIIFLVAVHHQRQALSDQKKLEAQMITDGVLKPQSKVAEDTAINRTIDQLYRG